MRKNLHFTELNSITHHYRRPLLGVGQSAAIPLLLDVIHRMFADLHSCTT
jgi:hypothetical protein